MAGQKAERLFYSREDFGDGTILELSIWVLPHSLPPSQHLFRYRLFFGRPGNRLVGFDNERGKGDHKHIREVESPYVFTTPDALVQDFLADVKAIKEEK